MGVSSAADCHHCVSVASCCCRMHPNHWTSTLAGWSMMGHWRHCRWYGDVGGGRWEWRNIRWNFVDSDFGWSAFRGRGCVVSLCFCRIWLNLSYSISLSSVWYTLRQSSRILELNMKLRHAIWGTELAMLRKPWERHRDLVAKVALDCVSRVSHHQAPSYIPACIILTMLLDSMLLAVCVNLWLCRPRGLAFRGITARWFWIHFCSNLRASLEQSSIPVVFSVDAPSHFETTRCFHQGWPVQSPSQGVH